MPQVNCKNRGLTHKVSATASKANQGVVLFAEQGETGFLNYAFEGLVSGDRNGAAIGVIAFILLTGGAFGIIMQSGAVNNGILALIKRTQNMQILFIPLMFTLVFIGWCCFWHGRRSHRFLYSSAAAHAGFGI